MKNLIILLTVVVIAHYLFFLFGFSFVEGANANFYMDNNLTLEKKGVFGDFTSGHFSILAFIWLAYGIYIQSKEFQLQREEFQNQTEQFKEQNKLYEQQMKELEIQSIQNQFDRKIAKLTEIEKNIANSKLTNHNVYDFIMECRQCIDLSTKINKFGNLQKYLTFYDNLKLFVLSEKGKIDLEEELLILKKDIYDELKISFMILLCALGRLKTSSHEIWYYKAQYEQLNIYIELKENDTPEQEPFTVVYKITNKLHDLDHIDIFKKNDPS